MHTKFWSIILKGREHSEDLDVNGILIIEWIQSIIFVNKEVPWKANNISEMKTENPYLCISHNDRYVNQYQISFTTSTRLIRKFHENNIFIIY